MKRPNLLFVFADQWRYQATGFGGNPQVQTPNLDRLAERSLNFTQAISGCPVCCPARGSLITGQYPDRHGVFVNDVPLEGNGPSMGRAFAQAGYDTGWIGKWHLNAHGRSSYIPPERRQGFAFWHALECTHDYNHSQYYADDDPTPRVWNGYDAEAQTRLAQQYIRAHGDDRPFCLVMSWGPPHDPYGTAPEKYRAMYDPTRIELRSNVPPEKADQAHRDIAGYYAHVTALDDLMGDLLATLKETGRDEDTLVVFWSDHGDMLGSQGQRRKQRPWEESIHVPLLIRDPRLGEAGHRQVNTLINTPDLLPTLLGLCGVDKPAGMQGQDYAPHLRGEAESPADAVLLACYHPFGEYTRREQGREYRGVRTERYTYVRDLDDPWLLYDNQDDPYQLENLAGRPEHADTQRELERKLQALLARYEDEFLPGEAYLERWGYEVDESGTVPYTR